MIKGALAGSLALIILYVVTQKAASDRAEEASNVLIAGLKRFLDPGVAGIGDHSDSARPSTDTPKQPGTPVGTTTGPYFQNL